MTIFKGDLYVGGRFTHIGSQVMNYIARWDGTSWSRVGQGFDYHVQTLFADTVNDILYAGGGFSLAEGKPAICFAQWNGTEWSAAGDPNFFRSNIHAITQYNGKIYAGGNFPTLGDTSFGVWDGKNWKAIQGPNAGITSLEVYQNELYVGGTFNAINGDSMFHIARWCDSTCVALEIPENERLVKGIPVFPNPATNFLKVESIFGRNTYHRVELINASGIRVYSSIMLGDEISLSLPYPSGLYVLHIFNMDTGERYAAKVLVQH
jgi:hypothetical protein